MIQVREAVIVEGRYDKIKLSSVLDAVIIETEGFGLFKDKEKQALIRRLAAKNGIVVLTDSDGAGFLIRNKLSSMIPPEQIKNAYIPDIPGKEKRKSKPSREGTLGVEGMTEEVLINALKAAGATLEGEASEASPKERITKADLYELGLYGKPGSLEKRKALLKKLMLPEKLSSNGLLTVLRGLYGRDEFFGLVRDGTGEAP